MAASTRRVVVFVNRNPRSLEIQGLKKKPQGCQTSKEDARNYFHRLYLTLSNKHTSAFLESPQKDVIISTSTQEPYFEQQLFKKSDKTAAQNVGKIMAQRCLESGIESVHWDIGNKEYHGKVQAFIDAFTKEGVSLKEKSL